MNAPVKPADLGVTLRSAFWVWLRVAMLSFGGPTGQIAVMHRILVEEKKWIGENRFLHALNYCMLLPGPEAQQLATYIGWLMHRTAGGLVAGGLFILPGIVSIMALSWIYALYGKVGAVSALFFGLKAAIIAVVLQAVIRIGKRALRSDLMRGMAVASFVGIFFFAVPFPLIVAAAACIGFAAVRIGAGGMDRAAGHAASSKFLVSDRDSLLGEELPPHARAGARHTLAVAALWFALWLAPVAAIIAVFGTGNVYAQIAVFFSKMAVVTFGGAYAVLAYVAQQAVERYHWLAPSEMLDGLGLAESTPGPLIMVLQFVAFMGAFRAAADVPPLLAGTLGGLLATWVTFAPCFLFIFLGAPFIERLRGNRSLSGALSGITAAVVGVVANLAVWFLIHTLFREVHPFAAGWLKFDLPVLASIDPLALALAAATILATFVFKLGMMSVLGGAAAAGLALYLAGLLG